MKNRPDAESCSAREAKRLLGVSIPTLKRMAADGPLESFRTPGGHLRVVAESIEAVRERRRQPRPLRDASPLLHNRRERLEELTLDAQELRARRELEKLRREETEEAEQRESEAEEREREQTERLKTLEVEQARIERQVMQEEERREAERELARFHARWLETATELLSAKELRWLSAAQRKEMLDSSKPRLPSGSPRTNRAWCGLLATRSWPQLNVSPLRGKPASGVNGSWKMRLAACPFMRRTRNEHRRQRRSATRLPISGAEEFEVRGTAEQAVKPVCQAVEKRLLDERLTAWAVRQLSWGSDDRNKARLRRECAEILADLPRDVSEAEAKEALEPTVREACQAIKERQAASERQARKPTLIQQGALEVPSYLLRLKDEREITSDEHRDSDLTADLNEAVRCGLETKLTGDESVTEVRKMARQSVDAKLELGTPTPVQGKR